MSIILNIPQAMITEHENWHMRPGNPAGGGRRINPWPPTGGGPIPGSGEEFLNWHGGYLDRFNAWVESLAANERPAEASIRPWTTIPTGFKMGMLGWNLRLSNEEQRVQDMSNFGTLDELGRFLEWSLHGFLHSAASGMFNEPVLMSFESPRSTYFWQLHGLIEHWRQQWIEDDQRRRDEELPASPFTRIPVGAGRIEAAIGSPGEIDRYQFSVGEAGTHTMETHGPTDVVMYLAGPDNLQRLIAVNDDGGEGRNARLAGFLPSATYYIYARISFLAVLERIR